MCVCPCMSVCDWQAGWGLRFVRCPRGCRWKQSWSVKAGEMCLSAPRELANWFLFDRLKPWHQPSPQLSPPLPNPPQHLQTRPGHWSFTSLLSIVSWLLLYLPLACCNISTIYVSPFIDTFNILWLYSIMHNSYWKHKDDNLFHLPSLLIALPRSQNSQNCKTEMTKQPE